MFRTVWDIYIKFYTVFLTFSIAAMGWLVDHKFNNPRSLRLITAVFIGQSLLTSITSGAMGIYSYRVKKQHHRAEVALVTGTSLPPELERVQTIPYRLGLWAGFANATSMIGMVFLWYLVGLV
jgi:hypothetical protein